jgi:hypothetical protein
MTYKTIFALVVINILIFSQFKNVQVNKQKNMPEEVSIAINPANPNNLIAGANINIYYWSTDKGATWNEGYLKSDDYGVWGDPCLVFDLNGNGYYFHLSRPSQQQWIDRMVCHKTTDGGATWSNPGSYTGLNLPKKQDKEWSVVQYVDGPRKNYIYLTWTQFDAYESKTPTDSSNIMFSYSSDAGLNWSKAKRINELAGDCKDSDSTDEGAVPAIAPNGDIYVGWSGPAGIVLDKSTDGGDTWLDKDIYVCPQVKGWDYDIEGIYRCNGMPVTCCDISSSPNRGNVYINFSDARNGDDDIDVFVVRSTDGGTTWNDAVRVNQDAPGNHKQQFMSWMSVDPVTGIIYVLFYDRREHDDKQTDVYLARSTDGGLTFADKKISDSPFLPVKGVFFGDYINVAAYNNQVACIWQRMDMGTLSVIYAGGEW